MKCLEVRRDRLFHLATLCLALQVSLVLSCKGGDSDDGAGSGGDGGSAGGEGGDGGGAVGEGGMAGSAGGTMGNPDAGVDAGPPTPPEAVYEEYAAPTGKLPVSINFKTADDLTKNFSVVGEAIQSADSDGVLKIAKGKAVVLTFDTKPDKDRTDTFEAFTATIKFHSEGPVHPWVAFATDKNRNDGKSVGFGLQNGQPGPPGVSDVDNVFYGDKCWAVSLFGKGSQCASETESYGWTAWEPSMLVQTVKVTVRPDKDVKTIRVRGEFLDHTGEVIDGSVYDWADVKRLNGEISFGMNATGSDAFIDEIAIAEAEAIADTGIVRLDVDGATLHAWVPPSLAANEKIKGIIITAPDLSQPPNGTGDFALFSHLRKFATAHSWALVGGARQGKDAFKTYFKQDLEKLATKANRPEMNTVPVFIQHLLNNFSYQALADVEFSKRIIAFTADKPRLLGEINTESQEKLSDSPQTAVSRAVPGFFSYSFISLIARRESSISTYYPNRFFEETPGSGSTDGFALWAYVAHGMQTNAVVDSWMLYLALLQEMIAQRTTNNDGVTPLKPVDKAKGYLGYSEAFKFNSPQVSATLTPFAEKGFDPAPPLLDQLSKPQPDFIPGPSTGLVWQAFDHCIPVVLKDANGKNLPPSCLAKKVFWTTSPKHGKPNDSRLMKLGIDSTLQGWKKIEIFDAFGTAPATPVKVLMPNDSLEYEFKQLKAGAHSFIAKLTASDDKVHITHPAMAIFAP